ncbi:coiled-coil domain containing 11 [Trypanosoma conorhini]|uniref:Cilia- and flagella-associated protein 53 n=1 Tax=Trypanosoma conorhini TaxID=83891 RepID=A0A422PIK6_9TRYP|nr:coiled-coil domain containing 11 [Trypanosoma conorhini]RNF17554.1 coiled-coil domain containing 11 [Trypanosoma conorhini]
MPYPSALALIEARQRRETEQRLFNKAHAEDCRLRLTANWEVRGDAVIQRKDLMRHLDKVQAQHDDALVARRKRLADMLLRERAEHEAMLNNLAETEEQRRERLIQKARELREQHKEDLRVDAQKQHERLFREKIDSLRLAESRLKVMQVSDARFEQLVLAERRREEQKREDDFFAQQRLEEERLTNERARRDLDMLHVAREKTKKALAAQVEGNKARKAQAQAEKQQEDDEFNRVVAEELAAETQRRVEARRARAVLAKEMSAFNEELRQVRRQEYEQLQQEDKEVLDRLLAELAEEERQKRALELERRNTARANLEEIRRQLNKRKQDEGELDKLWDEANNKEWAKREARWAADEAKRKRLMHNVLVIRRQQVLDKRQQEKDDAARAAKEREEFLRELANSVDLDAQERARRYKVLREDQKYLIAQMQRRAAEKEAERRAVANQLTDQQELEAKYAERIKREMENLERARPDRYKNVPLLPKKRHQVF